MPSLYSNKSSTILTGADNWEEWLGNIRRLAKNADIWDSIDPTKGENEVIQLSKPKSPEYSQVKASATTFAELDPAKREEWNRLNKLYIEQVNEFQQKRRLMNELIGRIQDTVDRKGASYISQCDIAYKMLQKL